MKALNFAAAGALAATLAGCAATPLPIPDLAAPLKAPPVASPFVSSSGMVIGTLSYHYLEIGGTPVVHLQRLDAGPAEDYALPVSVDSARHRGIFTGALPAGVYAFREVATAGRHFPVSAVSMPFEVQAGEVRDAGHYALNPVDTDP